MSELAWLAVDWGTTNVRVWAMGATDQVLDARTSADGMARLGGDRDAFARAFQELIAGWSGPRPLPAVVCGMAGGREGWQEAPYAPVGRPLDALADLAVRVEIADRGLDVRILPGVSQDDPPDVMRGEETKLLGLGPVSGLVVMPGTHPKWVRLEQGRLRRFHTAMTGEVFAAIASHTMLRHTLTGDGFDLDAFAAAILDAKAAPERLLTRAFGLRASDVLGHVEPAVARGRLSGWLTGLEIEDCLHRLDADKFVLLVGGRDQTARYRRAFAHYGITAEQHDADALTIRGLVSARSRLFPELPAAG